MNELHHEHVDELLSDRDGLTELQAAVQRVCTSAGLEGVVLEYHSLDLDVPIPGIIEVDSCSRLVLDDASGVRAGELYVDLWGEAYDMSYGTRVRIVFGEERSVLLNWPDEDGEVALERWNDGLARMRTLLGRALDSAALGCACAAAIPPPLRAVWIKMAQVTGAQVD